MKEIKNEELEFVAKVYDHDKFDTEKAISRFHAGHSATSPRRWWITAAASVASVAVAFAAGYAIHLSNIASSTPETVTQQLILNPDVATTHTFVYEEANLTDVLCELSSYYGCSLKADSYNHQLTATFPDDDINLIVSIIEKALDIKITVE